MSSAEHVVMSKSLTGERRRSGRIMHLLVYTMSTMVFGMICSALGPSIPWLASNADVTPETLGWLPAAQAVMCIVSGLASSLMAFVARKYHHLLLGLLLLWLGVFFMVLPLASSSIYALTLVFAFQVLPRPWIGQMTNLLVSELYEEPSLSSAAQSFNQGGFALGCVFMVMLEEISSSAFGGAAMFYIAGGFTGLSSLLFFTLPRAPEKAKVSGRSAKGAKGARESKMPSAFTLTCSCLGILAVGLEVACGTWLITSMTQMGFESSLASLCNIIFWLLFAVSRLVLAPCLCKCLKPRPSSMIIGGASLAALSCIAAVAWPRSLPAVLLGVSGIALGAGPSYAMTISMAKESVELTSVDSAMFAIASSLGAGLRTSLEIAPMQKLSHKVLQDDFFLALLHPLSKPTLLSVLCSNGRIDAELRDIGDVAEHSELLLVEERHKKKEAERQRRMMAAKELAHGDVQGDVKGFALAGQSGQVLSHSGELFLHPEAPGKFEALLRLQPLSHVTREAHFQVDREGPLGAIREVWSETVPRTHTCLSNVQTEPLFAGVSQHIACGGELHRVRQQLLPKFGPPAIAGWWQARGSSCWRWHEYFRFMGSRSV
eukprot:g28524.t1